MGPDLVVNAGNDLIDALAGPGFAAEPHGPTRRLVNLRTGPEGYAAEQVGVIPAPVPVPW